MKLIGRLSSVKPHANAAAVQNATGSQLPCKNATGSGRCKVWLELATDGDQPSIFGNLYIRVYLLDSEKKHYLQKLRDC